MQMLLVGLIDTPMMMLDYAQLTATQYILIRSYLLFKHLDTPESLQELH